MQKLTSESFQQLIDTAGIAPRVKREVRFVQSVANIDEAEWDATELLPITDRAGNRGVLVFDAEGGVYATSFEISRGITNRTGKAQPIICDFCRTWQTGSRSGSVTLQKPGRDTGSITFLCCADLDCSKHVRNLTSASRTSRAQLREDMTIEQRVERLTRRVEEICTLLGLQKISL